MKSISSTTMAAIQFKKIIADIFRYYNFTVTSTHEANNIFPDYGYDLYVQFENQHYVVEIKYSRNESNHYPLCQIAQRLMTTAEKFQNSVTPIIIIGAKLTQKSRCLVEKIGSNIILLDIQNLLYIIQKNENIKNNLISLLEFSTNDILPEKPNTLIFDTFTAKTKTNEEIGIQLKTRINNWSNSNPYTEYENLCYETLHFLFNDELSLWHKQETSNSELYRFDLICKIKDGDVSGLWSTLLRHFNSKYIIFEFKNYVDKISQKEIYITDRYLYLKALRSVAIIISCKGASENAQKAIRGTLRENGKLILSINNKDLSEMIDIKMRNEIPADYLYGLLDNLLIDLEK